MQPEALEQPDEPPPSPIATGQESFLEVLEELQKMHQRLRDAYELERAQFTAPPVPKPQATLKVVTLPNEIPDPEMKEAKAKSESVSSENILPPRKVSSKVMQKARNVTQTMENQIDANSMDSCALQLRDEWDLPEEKLLDLKRIQRRLSCGSLRSKAPDPQRKFLVEAIEPGPWYIMNPNSTARLVWDCLALIAVLFEICLTPLHLYRMEDSMREVVDAVHLIMTGFWGLDIVASFLTAVYVNDILRYRLRDIARSYLRSWFVFDALMLTVDLVASLVQDVDDRLGGVLRATRARRMFRLLRFFQVARFLKILTKLHSLDRLGILRSDLGILMQPVIKIILLVMFSVHLLGSLWFAVGDNEAGWVQAQALEAQPLSAQYARSLEWAIAKLPPSALKSTVELNTAGERWLGIIASGIALLCGSVFVSMITNTMAYLNRKRTRTTEILEAVRKYCGTHSIAHSYTMQIKRYVNREHARNEIQSHMPLLQNLPEAMIRELFQEGRSHTLHGHSFFKEIGRQDLSMELNLCSDAVSELYLLAGDVVFNTTSKTNGMYLMDSGFGIYFYCPPLDSSRQRGSPQVKQKAFSGGAASILSWQLYALSPTGLKLGDMQMAQALVDGGDYLAEPALWVKGWRYQGQLQALVDCRALSVSTAQLYQVVQAYANTYATAVVYARCFIQELNKSAELYKDVNDLPLGPAHPLTVARSTRSRPSRVESA